MSRGVWELSAVCLRFLEVGDVDDGGSQEQKKRTQSDRAGRYHLL